MLLPATSSLKQRNRSVAQNAPGGPANLNARWISPLRQSRRQNVLEFDVAVEEVLSDVTLDLDRERRIAVLEGANRNAS